MIVLAIPDGAADAPGDGATCLEAASTPVLDQLAGQGRLLRVRTIAPGLPAGTEAGVPALLGVQLTAPPARGRLEAAAAGIPVAWDQGAWRLDVLEPGDDRRPAEVDAATVSRLDRAVARLGARVHRLRGHRLLLVGPGAWGDAPPGPHQTSRGLAALARGPFAAVAAAAEAVIRPQTVWPWGLLGEARSRPALPERLRRPVTLVTPGGVVAGIGRLLGCGVVQAAPARAPAVVAGAGDDAVVVVHDPVPDDAGHARDRAGKVRALESFDRDVVGPVAEVLAARGGRLLVCPDHSCDPATGRHGRGTVPGLVWASSALGGPASGPSRLCERAVAGRPAVPAAGLLAGQLARPEEAA